MKIRKEEKRKMRIDIDLLPKKFNEVNYFKKTDEGCEIYSYSKNISERNEVLIVKLNECEIEICEENERIIRWILEQRFPGEFCGKRAVCGGKSGGREQSAGEKPAEESSLQGKIQRQESRLRGRKPSGRSRRVHFPGDYPNDISISISVFYFPIGIPEASFSRSSSVR